MFYLNSWLKKVLSPIFQRLLAEVLIITNLWHVMSRICFCDKPELQLFLYKKKTVVITTRLERYGNIAKKIKFILTNNAINCVLNKQTIFQFAVKNNVIWMNFKIFKKLKWLLLRMVMESNCYPVPRTSLFWYNGFLKKHLRTLWNMKTNVFKSNLG